MLFGPSVRFGGASVQTQHELQVLVRFLLVRQRSVVRAILTATAARQHRVLGEELPASRNSGAGGRQHGDKAGQEEDTQ